MIVKNESRIIERLIKSVLSIIDSYCICDTGSTDNTPAIIERVMKEAGIPGEVVHEPFKDFGYNRTFALNAAKPWGDFALLIDADMRLVITPDFTKDILTPEVGAILIKQKSGDLEYYNVRLINLQIGATCVCPTHEYYNVPSSHKSIRTETLWIDDIGDGGCKADKFERDIRLLKEGLEKEPDNPRYHFYLGNSYANTNRPSEAIPHYKRRVELGGWVEEVFYSCLQLGHMYKRLNDIPNAIYWWTEGYTRHSGRAESLYEIVKHYRIDGKHKLADAYYQLAKAIPYPKNDSLFVQTNVYTVDLDYENSILAYYTGKPIDHHRYLELLGAGKYTNNLLSNYKFYAKKLKDLGGKDTVFTEHLERLSRGRVDKFQSSSPCLIPYDEPDTGCRYLMNVRYVNYNIGPQGAYNHRYGDGIIATLNKAYWLDASLNPIRTHWFSEVTEDATRYYGVEDVRLFRDGDVVRFMGVRENPANRGPCVGRGIYDVSENRLVCETMKSPYGRDCEKNWLYFHDASGALRILYEWNPITVADAEGTILTKTDGMPLIFSRLRGSAGPTRVGDELWFLGHIVEYANPRHYYHMIVILDATTMGLKRYSIPFKFHGDPIEYCLGFVVEEDRVLFSYSRWDRSSAVMVLSRDVMERELF